MKKRKGFSPSSSEKRCGCWRPQRSLDLARELGLLRLSETAMRKKHGAKSKDRDFFLHVF